MESHGPIAMYHLGYYWNHAEFFSERSSARRNSYSTDLSAAAIDQTARLQFHVLNVWQTVLLCHLVHKVGLNHLEEILSLLRFCSKVLM